MKEKTNVEQKIIEDYVGNIFTRLCRKAFGSSPTREHGLFNVNHIVYTHVIRHYCSRSAGKAHIKFDFPDVSITYWACGCNYTASFSVADPQSFDKINSFLSKAFADARKHNRFTPDSTRNLKELSPSKIGLKKRPKRKKRKLRK